MKVVISELLHPCNKGRELRGIIRPNGEINWGTGAPGDYCPHCGEALPKLVRLYMMDIGVH